MARPQKIGMDYYPMDVHIWEDMKIKKLEGRFKCKGTRVLLRLWSEIYQEGYYLDVSDEDVWFLIADGCPKDVSVDDVEQMVGYMAKIGIFNADLFEKNKVLTSVAIQRRYLEVRKRLKNTDIDKTYWLLEDELHDPINNGCSETVSKNEKIVNRKNEGVNVTKTIVNVTETGSLCRINSTKENKRKENKKKEDEVEENLDFESIGEEVYDMEKIDTIIQWLMPKDRERAKALFGYGADMRIKVLEEVPEVEGKPEATAALKQRAFTLMERLDELGIKKPEHVSWFLKKSGYGREGTPIWKHLADLHGKRVTSPLNYLMACMQRERNPATPVN